MKTLDVSDTSERTTAAKKWNSLKLDWWNISSIENFETQIGAWSVGACSCSFQTVNFLAIGLLIYLEEFTFSHLLYGK